MILLVFLLWLLLFKVQSSNLQCLKLIDAWKHNLSSIPSIVGSNSGKFLNDLGDYNNCQYHNDEYTYLTLIKSIYGTMCAQYMCLISSKSIDFPKHIECNKWNVSKCNQKLKRNNSYQIDPKMGTTNIIILIILLSLFLFEIMASILVRLKKKKNQQEESKVFFQQLSIYDNFKKIVEIKQSQNQNLLFLNGLRVFSICWIIFGHDQWLRYMNLKNWVDSEKIVTTPGIMTLSPAAYFAVDIFFWIGGFLITISLITKMKEMKTKPITFYVISIIHRFIRVWPTYIAAILIYWKIAPFISSGPIWAAFNTLTSACNNGGVLWNMFFVDNFGNHGPTGLDYCFGWGWYLAVDFQFFLITPLLFFVYNKNKKTGLILTFIIWVSSIIIAFVLIIINDWRYPIPNAKFKPQPEFLDRFYYKPYIRISTYLMGIWVGMFYIQWKNGNQKIVNFVNKILFSKKARVFLYVIGLTLINVTIWIVVPFQKYGNWTTIDQAFYNSFNRVCILLGVSLICFSAMFGCKNDPIHKILGHRIFVPFARISFCMYLVHFIVIITGVFSNKMDLYWQSMSSIYQIISDIFWTVILAVLLSLLIQSPTLGIQKILTSKSNKKILTIERKVVEQKQLCKQSKQLLSFDQNISIGDNAQK